MDALKQSAVYKLLVASDGSAAEGAYDQQTQRIEVTTTGSTAAADARMASFMRCITPISTARQAMAPV